MERREFVKVIGVGGALILLPPVLESCGNGGLEALLPWKGPLELPQGSDIRLKFASFAVLAPNAHNKQPWIIDLRGEGIDLYVDPHRLLPQTDPFGRQIMISQGTFLETLSIAATHYGFKAIITMFPNGIDSLEAFGTNPVAHVAFEKSVGEKEDRLFIEILKRHTNRRAYSGPSLKPEESLALKQSYSDRRYPFRIITDLSEIQSIAGLMTEAMRSETYNREMHAETVEMLRFTDEEVEQYRDGMSFPNLGITGTKLFFARMFAGRSSAFDESFLQRTVDSVKEAAHSARAICLISSVGTSRSDEVIVGRHFARVFLTATALGLSLQPMSQIMEISHLKEEFVKELNLKDLEPQMLFRLGRSEPTPHSPRRAVHDFVLRKD